MGIPIIWADPWVYYKGPPAGKRKDSFFQQDFAAGDHNVGSGVPDEMFSLWSIGAVCQQHGKTLAKFRVQASQFLDFLPFPRSVSPRKKKSVVGAKGQNLKEPHDAYATDLAANSAPHLPIGLPEDYHPCQVRE